MYNDRSSIQTETESSVEIPGRVPNQPLNIFQPNLLRLKQPYSLQNNKISLDEMYKKQSKEIKKKIKEVIKMEKKLQQEERQGYTSKMKEALLSFYRNPFKYMDYLIEKYFKGKYEGMDEEAIKKFLLQELRKDSTLKEDDIFGVKNIISPGLNIQHVTNNDEPVDIKAEPITQKDIENILASEAKLKFNTIINTKSDIKNSILNTKYSHLNQENILKQALTCLKGPQIVIPKSNFIQVKNLEESHINKEEMKHATRLFEIERNFEEIKKNSEDLVLSQINRSIKTEKKIFEEMIDKANQGIQRMEKGGEVSEELLAYIKSKVDQDFTKDCIKLGISKLNIFEKNLDDIKEELKKYETPDQECIRFQERLRILEENTRLADIKAEKFIEEKTKQIEEPNSFIMNDKVIDKLYLKYKPKHKKKGLNLYNDNPFHYNYNFGRNRGSASKIIQPAIKINSKHK